MAALALIHKPEILAQIAQGKRLTDIAHALGYKDHSAIVHRLRDDPAYLQAREIGAEARLDQREADLETASDSVTIARARELMSQARWRCEREFPHRWGAKQSVDVQVSVRVEERLERDLGSLLGRVIDVAPEQQNTHQISALEGTGVMSNDALSPDSNTIAEPALPDEG